MWTSGRLVVLVVLLAVAHGQSISPRLTTAQLQDRRALLSIKNAVVAAGSSRLNTWRPTGKPCEPKPWPYVSCSGGRVTRIDLANLGLAGRLPDNLRLASELVELNLADNKFTGTIPAKWANQQTFRKLRVLNLANNNFQTTLPGPTWDKLNAWKVLETLNLSGNKFYGGLPNELMKASSRVLRSLKLLDLSSNALGYDANGDPFPNWCTAGATSTTGWCPTSTSPDAGLLASLEVFDISNNDLTGALPRAWPRMMPRLTTLLLSGNLLSRDSIPVPTPLPDSWAGGSKRGWPALQQLVLYPGNEYLCSIPEDSEDAYYYVEFRDVNLESSYRILDSADGQWGAENPAICPVDLDSDQIVDSATITLTAAKLGFQYGAAGTASLLTQVYGFRVTISEQITDLDGETMFVPLPNWGGKLLRSYTGSSDYAAGSQSGVTFNSQIRTPEVALDGVFPNLAHTISPALTSTGLHQVAIGVVLVDGTEGAPVTNEVTI